MMSTRTRVLVAMPVYDRPMYETDIAWRRLVANPLVVPGVELVPATIRHFSAGTARNLLLTDAKKLGCAKVLFIDHDMAFGDDSVARILSHDAAIVGATYPKRTVKRLELSAKLLKEPETNAGLRPALHVGAGFMAVDMQAIAAMERAYPEAAYVCFLEDYWNCTVHHFFAETVVIDDWSKPGQPPFPRLMGEDMYFCHLARKAGISVYADMRCEVGHIGTVDFLEVHRRLIAAKVRGLKPGL